VASTGSNHSSLLLLFDLNSLIIIPHTRFVQILLSLNGVTREKLAEFDVNLQKMLAKKKRRGLMKDLITEIIGNNGAQGTAGSASGSVFSAGSGMPSVLNVRHRLMRCVLLSIPLSCLCSVLFHNTMLLIFC